MQIEELKGLNDITLYHLLANPSSDKLVKEEAAFELYRRGSKLMEMQDFRPYHAACVDRDLKSYAERRASHTPNKILEALGRLFQRAEITDRSLSSANASLDKAHESVEHAHRRHDEMLKHKETLEQKIDHAHGACEQRTSEVREELAAETASRESGLDKLSSSVTAEHGALVAHLAVVHASLSQSIGEVSQEVHSDALRISAIEALSQKLRTMVIRLSVALGVLSVPLIAGVILHFVK